ncbi:unnamed protein product [Mytilus coruscus]|uniref:Uncharacterized protein n=1 Tax=Mytilus coruscus TaxID=42192 RepID=A0A6J8CH76_MYTCO|nr:unnamed protein product [Mytilus coruscus]
MLNQDIQDEGTPVKQQCVPHECPPNEKLITTSVEIGSFEICFHVAFDKKYLQPGNEQVTLDICHIHYMHFKNYAARSNCCICESSTTKLKRVNVEDRLQLFKAVIPKPSEKNENLDIASHEHIEKTDHRKRIEMSSNRTLPSDIIKSLKKPNNLIGEPSEVKYNKFQALKLVDFQESEYLMIPPIFIKIFYDAGLKELAGIYHHGATLKVLTECTKFSITHRFFCHVWEAMLRCQIDAYKNQEAVIDWRKELDTVLNTVLSSCDHTPDTSEKCAGDILDFEVWKRLLQEKSKLESLLDGVCTNFNQ